MTELFRQDERLTAAKLNRLLAELRATATGGATLFTELLDVPGDYTGQAGKVAKVNATEDGLEFGDGGGGASLTIGATRTADFTLALGDANTLIPIDSPDPVTVTVPPDADVAFPNATQISFVQLGAGAVALTGLDPVAGAALTARAQGSTISIYKRAADAWHPVGDYTASAGGAATTVEVGGTLIATRGRLNLIAGASVTIGAVDDAANDKTNVTIAASPAAADGCDYSLAKPVLGDLSWINQGGATAITDAAGNVVLRSPSTSGDSLVMLVQSLPASPWKVRLRTRYVGRISDASNCGMVLREVSTGRIIHWGNTYQAGWRQRCMRWNSPTSFSASPYDNTSGLWAPWVEIEDTGSQYVMRVSSDGMNFAEHFRETRTAFFTAGANQFGWCMNTNRASTAYDLVHVCYGLGAV